MRANVVHPVADEWTDEYAVYASSVHSVLLTQPLASFLDFAVTEQLRPVLVSAAEAAVSPFVSLAMRRAGGFWAVKDADGRVFDGLSGYRIFQFSDLWSSVDTSRERLSTFTRVSSRPHGVLMFEAYAHQRAAAETVVGQLGAAMLSGLGGALPDRWGANEPLTDPWSAARVTELARRSMPVAPTVHARALDGSFVDIGVGRTPRGILERAQGGVPVGATEGRTAELIDRGASALTTLAQQFVPTVAFVSLAELDEGMTQGPSGKRPEVPLAVLIGARAVHDLDVDAAALSGRHDVTALGRKRNPSLLVRFSGPDEGLWAQLVALGRDLGAEKVAEVARLDGWG